MDSMRLRMTWAVDEDSRDCEGGPLAQRSAVKKPTLGDNLAADVAGDAAAGNAAGGNTIDLFCVCMPSITL